ncbi:lysozyme family protein [Burkholderia alba]|uniref:hypothetical protein n=1 Tax=Burkholderia alba TaxID=2683677 RepID=UPI002B060046|nr:hypothetical protein [Burkholderia alba]
MSSKFSVDRSNCSMPVDRVGSGEPSSTSMRSVPSIDAGHFSSKIKEHIDAEDFRRQHKHSASSNRDDRCHTDCTNSVRSRDGLNHPKEDKHRHRHQTSNAANHMVAPRSAELSPAASSNVGPMANSSFNVGENSALQQWSPDIQKAANLTHLDPNLIGAQIWAESRGDGSSKEDSRNMDGTTDRSLMQISDERWQRDVIPTLSAQDKANIKAATGKEPSQLSMSDPHDNVVAGAFELRSHIVDSGGSADHPMANGAALQKGLAAYRGVGDGKDMQYARQVIGDENNLEVGRKLDDNEEL